MSHSRLTDAEVVRIAELARIAITSDKATALKSDLEGVLDFVSALQDVDTSDIDPTSQVTGLVDVLREDKVVPSEVGPSELLKRAPATQDGYIKVKRVIK